MGRKSLYEKLMFKSRLTAQLRAQSRRFCYGVLLYMVVSLLLAVLRVPSLPASIIVIGGSLVLLGLWLRFFHFLFFKKDE